MKTIATAADARDALFKRATQPVFEKWVEQSREMVNERE